MENSGVVHMLKNNKTDGKLICEYQKKNYILFSKSTEKNQI